jgi:DNA polymerase-3 subunit delta'
VTAPLMTGDPLTRPVAALFDDVIGQEGAVEQLRSAARRPVHAYLFHGTSAVTRVAARSFAAALLCPFGGCGECRHCERALAGTHPDLVVIERTGVSVSVGDTRRVVALAQRRPLEADRQVLVIPDLHLAQRSAAALLKTIEEPPPATVIVGLAEQLIPELETVVSRSVVVPFVPLAPGTIARWLVHEGVEPSLAALVAEGSGGDVDRARLLAQDPGYVDRLELWRSVPARLDATGAVAGDLARTLLGAADGALAPLRARHEEELEFLAEDTKSGDRVVVGRKDITDRQHREERRWRTEEIKAGLGVLARTYRDRLAEALGRDGPGAQATGKGCVVAVRLIGEAASSMEFNPNESLMLEALLARLGRLGA